MEVFCISEKDGYPVFDAELCNTCQKCVAICPSQAIMVNHEYPVRIKSRVTLESVTFFHFLEQRRSIKTFIDKGIPVKDLEMIIHTAIKGFRLPKVPVITCWLQ